MKMLGLSPVFDEVTKYSNKWFNRLVDELKDQEWKILQKDQVLRFTVEKVYKENKFDIVVFYDHGEKDALIGSDEQPCIDTKNIKMFKNSVIYTMACLSASVLGVKHFEDGGIYWGYTEVFSFVEQEEELFCEAANYGLIVKLRKDISWDEALKEAKKKFDEAIEKSNLLWSKIWLMWDRDHLVCYTKENPPEKQIKKEKIITAIEVLIILLLLLLAIISNNESSYVFLIVAIFIGIAKFKRLKFRNLSK